MSTVWSLTITELRRFRGALPALSALFLVSVPLLYGAIYLWSNWDPYGRLDHLKVAVVNLDEPVESNGATVAGGKDIVDQLTGEPSFDWQVTDEQDAAAGVASGRYAFSLVIPKEFSGDLTSVTSNAPRRASVEASFDNSQGYILGIIAQTAEKEIQAQLNAAAIKAYAESALGSLSQLRAGLDDAAKGADQLAAGSAAVAKGVTTLEEKVVPIIERASDVLESSSEEAVTVSGQVASTTGDVAELAARANERHARVKQALDALEQAKPSLTVDPLFQDLAKAVADVGEVTGDVASTAGRVADDADTVAGAVQAIAERAPELVAAGQTATSQVDRLRRGADQVAGGNKQLAAGLERATSSLPATSARERATEADALANPVRIASTVQNPATYYGRGLAPFFFGVALWVFGLVAFVLMRPISPRGLASPANPVAVALGGWLPAALLGSIGALLLVTVTDLWLGLAPLDWPTTAAVSVLAVSAFTALAQLLRVTLGLVGSAVMLLLLIVQLGAAGGLYPVETMPSFFQVAHPLVPVTYLVDALRVTISGGATSQLGRGLGVLAALLLCSLALTSVAAWRQRQYTPSRLHPALEG